jgi:hypothetical protein
VNSQAGTIRSDGDSVVRVQIAGDVDMETVTKVANTARKAVTVGFAMCVSTCPR